MGSRRLEKKPLVGITLGDPAGIGPEVALKALRDPKVLARVRPVLLGPRAAIEHYASRLAMMRRLEFVAEVREATRTRSVQVLDTGCFALRKIPFGRVRR